MLTPFNDGSKNRVIKRQLLNTAGFTSFELTIVLILVAILTAILLFKIELLQYSRYNKLSVKLTAQAFQSAVDITHNLWLVKGDTEKAENPQELKNQTSLSGSLASHLDLEKSLLTNYGKGNVQMSSKGWPIDAADTSRNSSTCTRLWDGLLTNTSPMVKVFAGSNNERAQAPFIYSAEFNKGVCIYRYLLLNNDWRIEYDLETGDVSAIFE